MVVVDIVKRADTMLTGSVRRSKRGIPIPLENLGKCSGVYEKDNRQKAESLAEFLKALDD